MSASTIGIPNIPKFKIDGIKYSKLSHLAALSPVQWAAYLPELTKVDLSSINGLLPVTLTKATRVAFSSTSPYKFWELYYVMLPKCRAIAGTILLLNGRCVPLLFIL